MTVADATGSTRTRRKPAPKPRRPVADDDEDDAPVQAAGLGGPSGRADSFDRIRSGVSGAQGGDAGAEDEHAWLTTYTDMVTLLLTCFIVLISVATFDGSKTESSVVPPNPERIEAAEQEPVQARPRVEEPAYRLPDALFLRQPPESWSTRLSRNLQRFVDRVSIPGGLTIETADAVVTMRLNEDLLFPTGRVEIGPSGQALLAELAPLLIASPARIEVEGHSDSVPISSWLFPSNWELSSARAAAVVRALIAGGMPADRIYAAGFADTRPLASNATAAGRQANRRVELVLRSPFESASGTSIPGPEANR